MSRIKTFVIGRHQDCDLRLDDKSVSRRHAEVVLTPDGRYYVTDCNSTGGTFVYRDSGWCPIRQELVDPTDRLRFGNDELAASRLESLRTLMGEGGTAPAQGSGKVNKTPDDGLDPNKGLRRNPETGEIMEK